MALLHGLEDLYVGIQGNTMEWPKIVLEISPLVTDNSTGRAIPGREVAWHAVTEYRMRLARDAGRFDEAERFARALVDYFREEATPFLADEAKLAEGHEKIHNLAVVVESLANYLSQQGSSEGLILFEDALKLSLRIGDRRQAAICAQGLGWAYREVESVRNLDKALACFVKGIELAPDDDVALKGKLMLMCGSVFLTRFKAAYARRDVPAAGDNAARGIGAYEKALELLPVYAHKDRAECLVNLGVFYLQGQQYTEAETIPRSVLWHDKPVLSISRPRHSSISLRL